MMKTLMAAASALGLMSGAGFAQSSYSSSTTQSTTTMPSPPKVDSTETVRRTEGRNGVMIEKDKTVDVTQPADMSTTKSTTETTTVR